jgi:flagellar basal-body rod modification protein FlgD
MSSPIGSNVLSSINQTSSAATAANNKASGDLRTNFMTLLTTQLQNQDPTKPLENAELTSQLAQINTVSGIEELNKTMTNITSQVSTGQQIAATQLIGRGVLVAGDNILVGKGETTPFGFELSAPSDKVTVTIKNSAGDVVRTYGVGPLKAGVQAEIWDGKITDGTVAPDGAYTFSIDASAGGVSTEATELNYAMVGGVSKDADGNALLDLGGAYGQVKLSDVRQIISIQE